MVLLDGGVIAAFLLLALAPIVSIVVGGISSNLLNVMGWPAFHRALLASLIIAIASALLATALATVMAAARVRVGSAGKWVYDLSVSLYLAESAIVLGTGIFILLRGLVDVFLIAPFILLLANMLVALPFSYRIIQGKMAMLAQSQDKLCSSLEL